MPRTTHKIINRHAFSSGPSPSPYEKQAALRAMRDRDFRRLNELIAAFRNPASTAKRAVDAGIESATGDQQKIEDTNRKYAKQLANPLFAASYFAAQRLTRNKVLRSRRI